MDRCGRCGRYLRINSDRHQCPGTAPKKCPKCGRIVDIALNILCVDCQIKAWQLWQTGMFWTWVNWLEEASLYEPYIES